MQLRQPLLHTDSSGWQKCECCGVLFRLLIHSSGLPPISVRSLAQRRAYQCANCGQMVCNECSKAGFRCLCKTNAWVARPVFMRKRQISVCTPMGDP
jgi:hypothetical protein